MSTDIANEPLKSLATLIGTQTDLLAIVGQNYGESFPADQLAWPMFAWYEQTQGAGSMASRLDVQVGGYCEIRLQLDVFGTDEDVLRKMCRLIEEGLGDAHLPNGVGETRRLDSTHWKCVALRQIGDWKVLPWKSKQATDGLVIFQRASDWLFKLMRKELVA